MFQEDADAILERTRVLIQMRRYDDAKNELAKILSVETENFEALIMLCECCFYTNEKKQLRESAERLISLYPDNDISHYYMALAFDKLNMPVETETHVRLAIEINPYHAEYFGFLAGLYIQKREWEKALTYANQGLDIEPDSVTCLNHRTLCLTKLDRTDELYTAVEDTLNASPDNWYSHANVGWSKLETGDYNGAQQHFMESLRLNPDEDYARQGMKEAIKARNPLYNLYLKYSFWVGNMGAGAQWAVLIGFLVGRNIIGNLAKSFPILYIVVFALLFVVYSMWVIEPFGDFILLMDRYGKYVLKKNEKWAGIITGVGVISGLSLLLIGFIFGSSGLMTVGFVLGTVIIPIAQLLNDEEEDRSAFMKVYTASIVVLAVGTIVGVVIPAFDIISSVYWLGIVAYTWIYNIKTTRA